VTLTDPSPVATKRKAESPSVEHSQDRTCKRVCAGQGSDKKALVREELTSIVNDFSAILRTRLTAICDILCPAELDSPLPPSNASCSSNAPGPLAPSSPVSPVDGTEREKALMLVAEFWKADTTRRKQLRNQAKAAQVFPYFEDEIQKANARRKTGLEGRIRQH
jgi:hypothetical protein